MKNNQPIAEFKVDTSKLSKNEKQVLDLLVEAARLIAPVYLLQENHDLPGANFYPKDANKEEIEKAAAEDPEILSPYTIVERKDGKLVATAYHEKYAKLLQPVVEKMLQAARITEDKEFARRLEYKAQSLQEGNYDEEIIYWLRLKPYTISFLIGPIERYDDRLFFKKTAYQAWVGIMDKSKTELLKKYQQIVLGARRKVLMTSEKVDYYDKIHARIDDLVIYSGRISRTMPVGINLPNDPNLMERYGSKIIVFKQPNELRVKNEVMPTFNSLFSADLKEEFSEKNLEEGALYESVMHELAHTYLRYRNSERSLKDLFPVIDELSASVMGMKVCGSLILKEAMNQKQLESMMLYFLARCFNFVLNSQRNLARAHNVTGAAIFINFLLESGALKESGGVSWPNFIKMFMSLDELASILERMLYQGSREDAESLIKRYGDIEKLQKFAK